MNPHYQRKVLNQNMWTPPRNQASVHILVPIFWGDFYKKIGTSSLETAQKGRRINILFTFSDFQATEYAAIEGVRASTDFIHLLLRWWCRVENLWSWKQPPWLVLTCGRLGNFRCVSLGGSFSSSSNHLPDVLYLCRVSECALTQGKSNVILVPTRIYIWQL